MSSKISVETEMRLASDAQSISAEALLKQRIERETPSDWTQPRPSLPAWHLGSVGALHRRDIYPSMAWSAQR